MKYPAYIDTNATSPVTRVGLQWEADTIIVINPTKYTVAVRVGSGSVPDTSNADMIIAPVSALCLPTEAREFTFIATTPTLTDAPDGMPTRVTLYLTKNEPSPAFGSISLAGQLPRAGVLVDTASNTLATSHPAVVVPPAIRRLMISPHAFSGASARVEIYGNLTGTQYYQGHPGSGFSGHTIVQLSALDTTLDIEYFPETTGAYAIDVIGFTEYGPVGSWGQDGRELVNPVALGATTVPVALPVPPKGTIYPSAVRAVSPATVVVSCTGYRGILLYLNITVRPAAETIQPVWYAQDPLALTNWRLDAPAVVGAPTAYGFMYAPGLIAADRDAGGNITVVKALAVPSALTVQLIHSAAGNWTYSLEYELLP